MRPVEQTATSAAPTSRSLAASSAVACVSWKPFDPVQALAPPALSTTARTAPVLSTCWLHSTGAAFTRLLVKTPAASARGPSLTTTATSSPPDDFSPAAALAQGKITILSSMTSGSATGDQMAKTVAAFEAASGIDVEVEEINNDDVDQVFEAVARRL